MTTCASRKPPPSVRTLAWLVADMTFFHSFAVKTWRRIHKKTSSDVQQPGHAARCGPGALQLKRAFQQPTHCRSLHSACKTLNATIGRLHASPLYRSQLRSRPGKPHLTRLTNEMAYLPILYHDEDQINIIFVVGTVTLISQHTTVPPQDQ
jgi:hypothetical protein